MKEPIALRAGKKFVRPETGFIHDASHTTIPLYENFNWALALFKTRTQEGVQEAKRLLAALLPFQNSEGEFPVNLHEYPVAHDHFLGAHLFFPLYWIQHDFNTVLGPELGEKLQSSIHALVEALKRRYEEKKPQGIIALKVGAVVGDDTILKSAKVDFSSSNQIVDLELCRDLGVPYLPTPHFWLGTSYKEPQEGFEPAVTLLDLMMGTERESELTLHHLGAALIRRSLIPAKLIEDGGYVVSELKAGHYLYRFITKSHGKLESLVLTVGHIKEASYSAYEGGVRFQLRLSGDFEERPREIELFVNRGVKLSGSTFRLDETVTAQFEKVALKLTFTLLEGEGNFIGHVSHGNRPSQTLKGEAFDQVLSLRTLRRSSEIVLGLDIQCVS